VQTAPRWRLALVALGVAAALGTAVAQRPEFLSPLVDHLPVSKSSPQPKDVLGYHR